MALEMNDFHALLGAVLGKLGGEIVLEFEDVDAVMDGKHRVGITRSLTRGTITLKLHYRVGDEWVDVLQAMEK